MILDLPKFFSHVRADMGALTEQQVTGIQSIVNGYASWTAANADMPANQRWLAYCLATAWHETGRAMLPVTELGGDAYLQAKPYYPYIGRGLVQLTWDDNYSTFGARLGIDLVNKPDLALEPETALRIMLDGMAHGHFTGRRLGQYFGTNPALDNAVTARAIINGSDKAELIAGYHSTFARALAGASYASGSPAARHG